MNQVLSLARDFETDLLIQCCLPGPITEVPQLPADFDWDGFVARLFRHRIGQLAYVKLRTIAGIPDSVMHRLRQEYGATYLESERKAQIIGEVVRAFKSEGIDILCFKGIALSAMIYPPPTFRHSADIDALVRPTQAQKAVDLLRNLGFKPGSWIDDEIFSKAFAKGLWQDHCAEYPFVREDSDVDLHWRVFQPEICAIDAEELFDRQVGIELNDMEIPSVSPTDHALIVSVHGTNSTDYAVTFLSDMVRLAESALVDWSEVLTLARKYDCEEHVWMALGLAARYSPKAAALLPSNSRYQRTSEDFLADCLGGEKSWSRLKQWLFRISLKRSPVGKVRLAVRLASDCRITPFVANSLNRPTFALYRLMVAMLFMFRMGLSVMLRTASGHYRKDLNLRKAP